MKDDEKTKEQLIAELQAMRQKIAVLTGREEDRRAAVDLLSEITRAFDDPKLIVGRWMWYFINGQVVFEQFVKRSSRPELKRHFVAEWEELVHPDDRDSLVQFLVSSRAGEIPAPILAFRTRDTPVGPKLLMISYRKQDNDTLTPVGGYLDLTSFLELFNKLGHVTEGANSWSDGLQGYTSEHLLFALQRDIVKTILKDCPEVMNVMDSFWTRISQWEREALIESNWSQIDHFLTAISHWGGAVFRIVDNKYETVTPALANLFGLQKEKIVGRSNQELFGPRNDGSFSGFHRPGQPLTKQLWKNHASSPMVMMVPQPLRYPDKYWGVIYHWEDMRDWISGTLRKEIGAAGESEAMQKAKELALKVAKFDTIVLLTGESGAGKDHLARYIHDNSHRSAGPYFPINCATIPEGLAESELFGYEKSGHSKAEEMKPGHLEEAEGGTIFLNEIGDLPLPIQAKLLTFLETKKFIRLGGTRSEEVTVNARFIVATNKDLDEAMRTQSFRRDLFYRLSPFPIRVPPLRERKADILALVQELLPKLQEKMGLQQVPEVALSNLYRLRDYDYDWPGNVRELMNVLERALVMGGGTKVDNISLVLPSDGDSPDAEKRLGEGTEPKSWEPPSSLAKLVRPHGDVRRRPKEPPREVLEDLKKKYIDGRKWSFQQLAEALMVDRSTVGKWFKRHGLLDPESDSDQRKK